MSVRISATDWVRRRLRRRRRGRDRARARGARLPTSSTSPPARCRRSSSPRYGRMYQTPFADRIRHEAGIPTIAVGAISSYDHVNTIIAAGRADLCALARPHLCDPQWTLHAARRPGRRGRVGAAVPLGPPPAADRQGRRGAQGAGAPLRRRAPGARRARPWPAEGDRVEASTSPGRSRTASATITLDRRRAQEPADVRVLRRAARHLPRRWRTRDESSRGRDRGRGGQLLLGRRRARHHRPADRRWTCDGLLRLHAHDRRPGEGDARPARSRSSRRSTASASAPARSIAMACDLRIGTPRAKVAFLFIARRPGRLRHGRVRDAAAHHRPGPRGRAAVHRPLA